MKTDVIAGIMGVLLLAGPAWAGFTDNGDGTVTDNVTGLMWQQTDDDVEKTWEAALTYCEESDLANYSDWRLPNVKELRSIIDDSRYDPAIDKTAFPGTNSSGYWTSTTYTNGPDYAWYVHFLNGFSNGGNIDKPSPLFVRCVRGGQ